MLIVRVYRNELLNKLQYIIGIIEKRQTLPILSNVLISVHPSLLTLTTTDLEIQIQTSLSIIKSEALGSITVSGKKLYDILRSLPEGAIVSMTQKEGRLLIQSEKSRFNIQSLAAKDFPHLDIEPTKDAVLSISQKKLKKLLKATQFAMATQDIRYYLNGMLFSLDQQRLTLVATDAHRLSYVSCSIESEVPSQKLILSRKTVLELIKLLNDQEDTVQVKISKNKINFLMSSVELTSKIIDSTFPDYTKLIPTDCQKTLNIPRESLLKALQRMAILSNDKVKGVRLLLTENNLRFTFANSEQEEAEEDLEVNYSGESLEIGFNIIYLMDVLNYLDSEQVTIGFSDANSSALVTSTLVGNLDFKYIVMPMRI